MVRVNDWLISLAIGFVVASFYDFGVLRSGVFGDEKFVAVVGLGFMSVGLVFFTAWAVISCVVVRLRRKGDV